MNLSALKYEVIRTPLEVPLLRLRRFLDFPHRLCHPELREIYLEDERIHRLLPRLAKGENCIDVGCHYGSTLSHLLRLSPRGCHVAFEPTPRKAAFLRRKFPEVDIRELALSDHEGHATFYLQEQAGYSGLASGKGSVRTIDVECARLDDVVPRDRRFGFMKIDTEGGELLVLRGAREFLARDRPAILFECGPSGPPAFGYRARDLHDLLVACGYDVHFLHGAAATPEAFEAALVYPFRAFNWVALPQGVSFPHPEPWKAT